MPTKLSLGLATLVALGAMSGCRQVTIVDFKFIGTEAQPEVDALAIDAMPAKKPIFLNGLQETVGFYDLRADITIKVSGCQGTKTVLSGQKKFDGIAERITIELKVPEADEDCPTPNNSGGLDYRHRGTGGMGGIGGMSGASGGGGMISLPGVGGSAGNPDAGNADGGDGASETGGTVGTGGVTGLGGADAGGAAGECDDGGVHDAGLDLGRCEMPVGVPIPDDVPALPDGIITPKCTEYCAQIFASFDGGTATCPDAYANVTQCQRYCTLAGWPFVNSAIDSNDTIDCRQRYLRNIQTNPQGRASYCESAGPGGKGMECSGTMGPCNKLCNAWANICGGNRADCMTACAGNVDRAACRIPWLVQAASDKRYCPLVDLVAPSCLPPGCTL